MFSINDITRYRIMRRRQIGCLQLDHDEKYQILIIIKHLKQHSNILNQIINQLLNIYSLFNMKQYRKQSVSKSRTSLSDNMRSVQLIESIAMPSKVSHTQLEYQSRQLTFSKNEESTNSTLIIQAFDNRNDTPKLFESFDINLIKSSVGTTYNYEYEAKSRLPMSLSKSSSSKLNPKVKKILIDLRESDEKEIIKTSTAKSSTSKGTSHNTSMSLFNNPKAQSTNIKVFARIRPNKQRLFDNICSFIDKQTVVIQDSVFSFDQVFNIQASQQDIFQGIAKPTIEDVMEGFNGTIFTYGQTGSGKTFTMFGNHQHDQNKGIVPRTIEHLFQRISKQQIVYTIRCSMLQIYKENLTDLFSLQKNDLKIKESAEGVYVEGLSEVDIKNPKTFLSLVDFGEQIRKVATTKMNQQSSRSHTIIIIHIQSQIDNKIKKGKLYLVDLAGSEKIRRSGACGDTLQQAKKINLSLSCLGNVINALTTRRSNEHIPYRESKLTRILQDSLSGNCKTSIIVNISTELDSMEETISTLKFAERAKKIKNIVKPNIQDTQSMESLREIIRRLSTQLQSTKTQMTKYKNLVEQLQNKYQDLPSTRLVIPSQRALVEDRINNYRSKLTVSMQQPRIQINLSQISKNSKRSSVIDIYDQQNLNQIANIVRK